MSKKSRWAAIVVMLPLIVLAIAYHDSKALFLVSTIELVLIGIVVNSFVLVYNRRNWRANRYGRALMYSKVCLAALVDLSLLTSFLGPDWHYRSLVRVILFGGILIAQTRLLWLLFSTKHEPGRSEYHVSGKPSEERGFDADVDTH